MKGPWLGLMLSTLSIGMAQTSIARAQSVEPVDHWNTAAVEGALQSLEASDIKAVTREGRAEVTARTRDGLNVGVYAKACDPASAGVEPVCHGIEAIITFDPGPKADRKALAERLNHQFAPGKFMTEPNGAIRLSRYLVLDGAVTPANLRAELASLFAIGALTAQTLWPEAPKK